MLEVREPKTKLLECELESEHVIASKQGRDDLETYSSIQKITDESSLASPNASSTSKSA